MRKVILLAFVALPLLFARNAATPPDGSWPREIDSGGNHLVVYQPQVDSWKDNHIDARSAVIVTRRGESVQHFGIVTIAARTEVDRETRMVSFEDINIKDANFPSATALKPALLKAVRDSVPDWPKSVSLDRLLADLAVTKSQTEAESAVLKNDPPRVIVSMNPAVLIIIDGEPVYKPVEGSHYTRVMNTPALLLFDPAEQTFYLDGGRWWMTASSLNGSWSAAGNPPADLDAVRDQLIQSEEQPPANAPAANPAAVNLDEAPPLVYVSTVPAELLVLRGEPQYAPIARTNLLYVTNTESDLFMDSKSQKFYVLLAGRWFRADNLTAAWQWIPGEQLPADFKNIPREHPKGHVLASIPGTEEAREAVIANQIPQTATVRRSDAKLDVRYDGPPRFRPIEGTNLSYAVNTANEVIMVPGPAGTAYYAILHGIWFVAGDPRGPWVVADMIPAEIYQIPPSNPLYHVRYAYVYGATPDFVYVGYTPGYLGAFVSDGVVVFGTGWWYPGFCGPFLCYGWPWTWGFGFEFSYWGGGWFWHPIGNYWWYHESPIAHRIFTEHWNGGPRGAFGGANFVRNNVNVYNHWERSAVVARNFQAERGTVAGAGNRPDLYAGHDGQVYQRRSNGWYNQNNTGQWQRAPQNQATREGVEQQRQSRVFGQSRQGEFQSRGQVPGIPRTPAPMQRSAPMPRSAPSGGGGRRR